MKLPFHDEAMALVAAVDALTNGAASNDSFVETAMLSGTPQDVIAELHDFCKEIGIEMPKYRTSTHDTRACEIVLDPHRDRN